MSRLMAKGRYSIKNWAQYNESLVNRGSITFWFDDDVLANWEHRNLRIKNGRPFTYSDRAIEAILLMREALRLPYRQTEGMARSLLRSLRAELTVPDYTSLAKRAAKLAVSLPTLPRSGAVHVLIDSTGLKVFGEGEWKVRQHGVSKRRTWRKLHLCVDPATREILAEVLTENSVGDLEPVVELLEEAARVAPLASMTGDGAYDSHALHDILALGPIEARIPPDKNAVIRRHGNAAGPKLPRDEAIRAIRRMGRKAWKRKVGYHQRSLAETTMFRYKTTFDGKLKNRRFDNQQTEARLRCKILNQYTHLGLPQYG